MVISLPFYFEKNYTTLLTEPFHVSVIYIRKNTNHLFQVINACIVIIADYYYC